MVKNIYITLEYDIAIGKVSLNEIVYRLKEIRDELMLWILEEILRNLDDEISDRLTRSCSSTDRKGLGRHAIRNGETNGLCRGRKSVKDGYRKYPRNIKTVFGVLKLPVRVVQCCTCGAKHAPLLRALQIERYSQKEMNFEHEVIEAVIDTNYRRLVDGRSIDISLGGIHNIVAGSDVDKILQGPVSGDELSSIMADDTGIKQAGGHKGTLKVSIGITESGGIIPLGCFTNTPWNDIEKIIKKRIRDPVRDELPFIYDGDPGLDDFLADITRAQRCTWHAPRGLYHALWEDGLGKKDSQPSLNTVKQIVGIELPEEDYELLRDEDKDEIQEKYEQSKKGIKDLIRTFSEKGYEHGATYLEKLSKHLFTNIEIWLKTGVITHKTTSMLERLFREIGRRLKKIAWGWCDTVATNLSKMIVIKQCDRKKWERYWKEKLNIKGYFAIQIEEVRVSGSC
jgi:hypothetical protein